MMKENIIFINKQEQLMPCITYIQGIFIVSVDIETTRKFNKYGKKEGLDPYLSKIVMFQIGDLDTQFVIDTRKVDILELVKVLPTKLVVGHNLKFEYKHILHNYNIKLDKMYDTMIVEKILYNGLGLSNGLKDLIYRYLEETIDKEIRLEFLTIGDRDFTKDQIYYGAKDIIYPLEIKAHQEAETEKKQLQVCIDLEMLFIPVLGDMEYSGITFNKDKWIDTYNINLKARKTQENTLNQYILDNYLDTDFVNKQYSLFDEGFTCNISWNSSKQVVGFFKYLGICPEAVSKTTKKLSYTVDAKTLKASLNTINKDIPDTLVQLITDYLKFKEFGQACSTFGIDFLKHINPITGRIHSNYNQLMVTSRLSSNSPNLQNIPATTQFRRAFDSKPGYKIVNADYAGQETIVLVNKSEDKDLISFFKGEENDMHSFIASKIFPELNGLKLSEIKDKHKDKRQIAKAAGFAINYGGNGHTIAKNLGISEAKGDEVYDAYFKAFPDLHSYFKTNHRQALKDGYILIDEVTNRKVYLKNYSELIEHKRKNNWRMYFKLKSKIERDSQNFPIQGSSASITKYAGILFRKWIMDNSLTDTVTITNLIHDEINVECTEEISETVAKALEYSMEKAGKKWCKIIPLTAEAQIVDYWTH